MFFIWFGATVLCVLFTYFYIYETKGLSLEEVDVLYREVKSARKSKQWRPTQHFAEPTSHYNRKTNGTPNAAGSDNMAEHKETI